MQQEMLVLFTSLQDVPETVNDKDNANNSLSRAWTLTLERSLDVPARWRPSRERSRQTTGLEIELKGRVFIKY